MKGEKKMNKVFYPDDQRIIPNEEFIEYYSQLYYLNNSKVSEEHIAGILGNDVLSENDVYDVLAWKTGKIDHLLSEKNNRFTLYKKWEQEKNNDNSKFSYYKKKMDINRIQNILSSIKKDPIIVNDYIDSFKDSKTCIGPVYSITFLYFDSNGKYPIYDRFAFAALKYIYENYERLREPTFDNMEEIYDEYCKLYKKFIEDFNGITTDIENIRKLDQALWTYGHCLHVKKLFM